MGSGPTFSGRSLAGSLPKWEPLIHLPAIFDYDAHLFSYLAGSLFTQHTKAGSCGRPPVSGSCRRPPVYDSQQDPAWRHGSSLAQGARSAVANLQPNVSAQFSVWAQRGCLPARAPAALGGASRFLGSMIPLPGRAALRGPHCDCADRAGTVDYLHHFKTFNGALRNPYAGRPTCLRLIITGRLKGVDKAKKLVLNGRAAVSSATPSTTDGPRSSATNSPRPPTPGHHTRATPSTPGRWLPTTPRGNGGLRGGLRPQSYNSNIDYAQIGIQTK